MRWNVPVVLLSFSILGCAPAKFVCPNPGAPPAPDPELAERQCDLSGKEFPFENLAIEGGGVKGIAYAGALAVLGQAGLLEKNKLKRVAGTSAGAITAVLIALGYTPEEVRATLMSLDLESFKQGGAEGPARLVKEFGWYSGDFYLDWVQCQVQNKTGDPDTTFQELRERNQKLGLPDIYVVATDLTRSNWVVLSHETVPCMPVALAIRMSGSLPLFWNALRLDLDDFQLTPGGCRPPAASGGGDVFTDGGVLLNYPLPLFDTAFYVNGGQRDTEAINFKTLGLHLDPPAGQEDRDLEINHLTKYAEAVTEAFLAAQVDYFEHNPCDQERSVRIDNLGVSTADFNLTPDQKRALIRSGFDHTCNYLKQWRPGKVEEVCGTARPSRSPEAAGQ